MATGLAARPETTLLVEQKAVDASTVALPERRELFSVLPDCDAGMRLLNILDRVDRRQRRRQS